MGDDLLEARDGLLRFVEGRLPHGLRLRAESIHDALHGPLGLVEGPGDADLSGEEVSMEREDLTVPRAPPCVQRLNEASLAHVHAQARAELCKPRRRHPRGAHCQTACRGSHGKNVCFTKLNTANVCFGKLNTANVCSESCVNVCSES